MTDRTKKLIATVSVVVLMVLIAMPAIAGQDQKTSWGDPDLRGRWDFRSSTPFQRPERFKDKEFLTAEEVAEYESERAQAREDRIAGINRDEYTESQSDVDVGYNAFFIDNGVKMSGTMRTSLIIDPPDGRLPAFTESGIQRARARYDTWGKAPATPADRPTSVRCITGFNSGPPMTPGAYNNIMEVFQTEDHVAIYTEMVNDHRIIPLDNSEHLPEDMRLWKGDSRGRWDGDTLVVVTKNFNEHTAHQMTSKDMVLTEKFSRTEGGLLYEYTVDDPSSHVAPWSTALEMVSTEDLVYEYACHEGNLAMMLMLRGARLQEEAGGGQATDAQEDQWLASWYRDAAAAVREDK